MERRDISAGISSVQTSESNYFLTPDEALKNYSQYLTDYEREEIYDYPEVYYVGEKAEDKVEFQWTDTTDVAQYFDDENGVYRARPGDHIAYRYEIMAGIGKGSFAIVVRGLDHKTKEMCAIKIVRNVDNAYRRLLAREIFILDHLRRQDPNNDQNIIRLLDHFWFREHQVMIFECLSINLFDLNRKNNFRGFERNITRKFAKSVLTALNACYANEIVHADLKPENILLKTKTRTGLKLIDFGWSHFTTQKPFATYIQSRFYRAPEIILGGPYTMAIDIWSFGCILAEMVTGYPLFPGDDKHDQLAIIIETLGLPSKELLKKCRLAGRYFSREAYPFYCDVAVDNKENIVVLAGKVNSSGTLRGAPGTRTLHQVLRHYQTDKGVSVDDKLLDLLQRCLQWDPEKRIRPPEALKHSFILG